MSTPGPRSLTDWLRGRTDEELTALIRARPDLAIPAPGDLSTLANRASVRFSVLRALEGLDAFTLAVLEAFAVAGESGPVPLSRLAGLLPATPRAAIDAAVGRLRGLALVWGDDPAHLTATVREVLAPYPAGLGRPAATLFAHASTAHLGPVLAALDLPEVRQPQAAAEIAAVFADPARLRVLLSRCGDAERSVLAQLAAGPPIGSVSDALRRVTAAEADSPVRWLLAHGLLVAIDARTVELPREVGLALRGDAPLGRVALRPPDLRTSRVEPETADAVGAGQVLAALRLVETLAEALAAEPAPRLRAGGLGVRELRRLAKALDTDEPGAAFWVETVRAAGLLDSTDGMEPAWLPTERYDDWQALPTAHQWIALARAWLAMTRLPSLVGQRDDRGKAYSALSAEIERASVAGTRARVLGLLAEQPRGTVAPAASAVAERLAWTSPRRGGQRADVVAAVLAEAETLGVTGRGALTSYARALLTGTDVQAAVALADRLPEPLDHVLVQADLTVVAPGPLEQDLARDIALVADVESAGGATVYRITEATVRRALDAGRSAADLHELFRVRSRTPIPQSLTYLIDDVARRHGALRVGAASAYLRCDDASLIAQVLVDKRVSALSLRRLAPTVVASRSPVPRLLEVLRAAGYAPVAESPDGAIVLTRPDAARAPARPQVPARGAEPPAATPEQLAEVVRAMRVGDRALRESRHAAAGTRPASLADIPGVTSASTLGLLRQATQEGRPVWLGYVNAQGAASQRIVEPSSISGGFLHGYDHRREEMRSFALHRITGVALLDPDTDPAEAAPADD
jgi:Helicase conserved C-terminal domain/WYL domain